MRSRHFIVLVLIILVAGAIGTVSTQAPMSKMSPAQTLAQDDTWQGKKMCGWPPPPGVNPDEWANMCESCTSVPTTPEASAEGSLTTHSCDGGYEVRIKVVPAKTSAAGTMRPIMKGGGLGEEKPATRQEKKVGEIPEVAKTFTRYDAAYPFMNEKGVIIGETTIGGRRELYEEDGLFDIMELERLALERGSTAREIIQIMGEFADKYGYGDSGECLTIADPKEVWMFEIFGPGTGEHGAVWAAKRIPPGEIGVSANRSRITTLDNDPNFSMFSKNVYDVAEKNGWWKKGEPFFFNHAYGMSGSQYEQPPGVARAEPGRTVAEARPVGDRATLLGEARQEGHGPRPDEDPPGYLRGDAVRTEQQPAGRAVRLAESLEHVAGISPGAWLFADRADDRRPAVLLRRRPAGAREHAGVDRQPRVVRTRRCEDIGVLAAVRRQHESAGGV